MEVLLGKPSFDAVRSGMKMNEQDLCELFFFFFFFSFQRICRAVAVRAHVLRDNLYYKLFVLYDYGSMAQYLSLFC